jgi:DNA-binding MarR family transcriptional regulator
VSGLTGAQIAILVALEFNPGMTTQQLALREGLSGAGVSGHLARLEGKGLIRRERGEDPRSVGLFLTDSGATLVSAVRRQRTLWLITRLEELPPKDLKALKTSVLLLDRVSLGDR